METIRLAVWLLVLGAVLTSSPSWADPKIAAKAKDWYEVLGVQRGDSDEQIRKQFKAWTRVSHPEGQTPDDQLYKDLVEAYDYFREPHLRQLYDTFLSKLTAPPAEGDAERHLRIFSELKTGMRRAQRPLETATIQDVKDATTRVLSKERRVEDWKKNASALQAAADEAARRRAEHLKAWEAQQAAARAREAQDRANEEAQRAQRAQEVSQSSKRPASPNGLNGRCGRGWARLAVVAIATVGVATPTVLNWTSEDESGPPTQSEMKLEDAALLRSEVSPPPSVPESNGGETAARERGRKFGDLLRGQ